jgi:kynureninase
MTVGLDGVRGWDRADPLGPLRERFERRPDGVIYLDGNSLGAAPRIVSPRLQRAIAEEWASGLVRSWNAADWIGAPARIGAKIAPLVGANPAEVIACDSTSVNLFKLLVAALQRQSPRKVVLAEQGDFPTDLYIAQGVERLLGAELRLAPAEALEASLGADVAVIMLTHVSYRTGARHDMARITKAAHAAGALTLWDLSHSAGAMQLDLVGADADLAIGCGYKYLNGGPGAPAWLYVPERLQAELHSPLSGWMGHAAPFEFAGDYRPAQGIERFLAGTPPILSMLALECGVDLFEGVDLAAVETKAQRLADLYIARVEDRCAGHGLTLATPRDPAARGSQVSFAHPHAYEIMQALIARGVIGDFRAPDILRCGFTPLYLGYEDVWRAAETLAEVLDTGAWQDPRFAVRNRVT